MTFNGSKNVARVYGSTQCSDLICRASRAVVLTSRLTVSTGAQSQIMSRFGDSHGLGDEHDEPDPQCHFLNEYRDATVSMRVKTPLKFLGSLSVEFPRCQFEAVNLFKTFGLENSNDWTPSFIRKVCQNGIVNRNRTTF